MTQNNTIGILHCLVITQRLLFCLVWKVVYHIYGAIRGAVTW